MDAAMLKIFCKYQQTVLFEEQEFQKFSDTIITDPQEKLVSYYIFEQYTNGTNPSQTDILYALRMSHSTLRKILKKLIKIGYLQTCDTDDGRFTCYKPSEMVIEGFKIHTARHFKTLLYVASQLGDNAEVLDFIKKAVEKLLGTYADEVPYGDMDLDLVKSIILNLEDKKNNSVTN